MLAVWVTMADAGTRMRKAARVGVLALAAMAPPLAVAMPLSFGGGGVTSLTGNPGGDHGLELAVHAAPYGFTFPDGHSEGDWLLDSLFVVDGLASGTPGASRGHGTYTNSLGDSLELDFEGSPTSGGPGFVVMHLGYHIVGGSGRFAGAVGGGFENVTITLGPGPEFTFSGQGQLEVPEPDTLPLMLGGLAVLAACARRPAESADESWPDAHAVRREHPR